MERAVGNVFIDMLGSFNYKLFAAGHMLREDREEE